MMTFNVRFLWVGFVTLWTLGTYASPLHSQNPANYYRVDRVVTVRGAVSGVQYETCYGHDAFMVLNVETGKGERGYKVQISPRWFFSREFAVGDIVEVTGSCHKGNETNVILARSLNWKGETFEFRDQYGFPLWRGKGRGRMGGSGRGHGGKGGTNRGGRFEN